MKINNKINNIFNELEIKKLDKKNLFYKIIFLSKNKLVNNKLILYIIKSFIIILCYQKDKISFCINFLDNLINIENKLFDNVIEFFNLICLDNEIDIYDHIIEKVIIHTCLFFYNLSYIDFNFIFKTWYCILENLNKLVGKIKLIKMKTYILLLNETKLLLKESNFINKKNSIFKKIVHLCENNIKIINNYIN